MERLTKLIDGEWIENHDHDTGRWRNGNRACMTKLAAYEDLGTVETLSALVKAKEEGRLYTSPCADGTDIWWIVAAENVAIWSDIDESEAKPEIAEDTYLHGHTEFAHGKLGDEWFLSFEEAQAALERMEGEA